MYGKVAAKPSVPFVLHGHLDCVGTLFQNYSEDCKNPPWDAVLLSYWVVLSVVARVKAATSDIHCKTGSGLY